MTKFKKTVANIISFPKEKISLELASAETDAIIRNESLEEEQLNDIVSKYGTLQDDKDTILTKDDNFIVRPILQCYNHGNGKQVDGL